MATTPKQGLRYPGPLDPPDGPGGIYNLAMDVEGKLESLKPQWQYTGSVGTGYIPISPALDGMNLITVMLLAPNYTTVYYLLVWRSPFDVNATIVTQIAKQQINNTPGYVDPAFSVQNARLGAVISNAGSGQSPISANVVVTRIGANSLPGLFLP